MKLYFTGHDCKYAVEQMMMTLFPGQRERQVMQGGEALLPRHDGDAAMENGPAKEGKGGLCPVFAQALAVRVDEHEGDVLHVLYGLKAVQPHFRQRIEGAAVAGGIRGIEPQHLVPL